MGSKQFDVIQIYAQKRAREAFSNPAIITEIVSSISLATIREGEQIIDPEKWVDLYFSKAVESYFKELRMFCFHSAMELISKPEVAEDIAQDSIATLLKSEAEITYIKPWLKRVVTNKLAQYFHQRAQADEMVVQIIETGKIPYLDSKSPDKREVNKLAFETVGKLLGRFEFARFRKISMYSSLTKYAKAMKISLNTAKQHSYHLRINLKAAYLTANGWEGTPEILNYRQLCNIKKFIQSVLDVFGGKRADPNQKYLVFISEEVLYDAFEGASQLLDWGIDRIGNQRYNLYISFVKPEAPAMIVLKIKFNKAQRIVITECKKAELVATLTLPENTQLLIREGKPAFSFEEIKQLLGSR